MTNSTDLSVRIIYFGHLYIGKLVRVARNGAVVEFKLRSGRVLQRRVPIVPTRKGNSRGQVKLTFASHSLDLATKQLTAFDSFRDLVNAEGGYRPTIMQDGIGAILANSYDEFQFLRNDPRRVYRRTVA